MLKEESCPCCYKSLARNAKICTDCGIKVPSDRPVIIALGRDENLLYENAEAIIRAISWVIWFGLYPNRDEYVNSKTGS